MTREFIPYEQALALKKLGFNEFCLGLYNISDEETNVIISFPPYIYGDGIFKKYHILAPLYQQCWRWFKEKYKLYPNITQYYGESFFFKIEDMVHPRRWDEYPNELIKDFGEYSSEEEAELACLKKLIEITKTK
jgi:hypothetical protein